MADFLSRNFVSWYRVYYVCKQSLTIEKEYQEQGTLLFFSPFWFTIIFRFQLTSQRLHHNTDFLISQRIEQELLSVRETLKMNKIFNFIYFILFYFILFYFILFYFILFVF